MELMHILETAVNAVVPIVLLMLFGYVLRQINFLTDEFLKVGMKLIFDFLLPASLFQTAYNIESFSAIPWNVVAYSMGMLIALFLVGLLIMPRFTSEATRKGPLLQALVRSNSAIIGLPLAEALGGSAQTLAVTGVIVAFAIPLMNMLAVVALSIYLGDNGKKTDPVKMLKNILTNPLIVSTVLGLGCMALRVWQVNRFGREIVSLSKHGSFLYLAICKAGAVASPLALIILGGQFRFSAVGSLKKEIIVGTMSRVVVTPIIGLGCAAALSAYTPFLNCGTVEYPGLIALFGTPVAVSSAIMAGQMGNDEQLATQLVVWTSVISIATMFLTVCILMRAGLMIV